MNKTTVIEFAIVGHPNEGKSSVVSTLAEDDSVGISPIPGETVLCRSFPIIIDGKEVIKFIDTPGFQNPRQTISWMKNYENSHNCTNSNFPQYNSTDNNLADNNSASSNLSESAITDSRNYLNTPLKSNDNIAEAFYNAHKDNPDFQDECELLKPISQGAGIIYVVDCSRPIRNNDLAEMEILRITGLPRMAIINCKSDDTIWLDQWKTQFRKHFNSVRVFNAHKATYIERIELLESLKNIDQDWQPALSKVISVFKQDWITRNKIVSELIVEMLENILMLSLTKNFSDKLSEKKIKNSLEKKYHQKICSIENKTYEKIRKLFKHNIFSCNFPENSILQEELFSEKTWQFLGLKPKQLALTAGIAGGSVGAVMDIVAGGLTFGIFSTIGSVMGAGSILLSGKRIAKTKIKGVKLGGEQIQIGPCNNIQLLYVLLDRVLIFYSHIINWAHGRRDYFENSKITYTDKNKYSVTANWDIQSKKICCNFFKELHGGHFMQQNVDIGKEMKTILQTHFNK